MLQYPPEILVELLEGLKSLETDKVDDENNRNAEKIDIIINIIKDSYADSLSGKEKLVIVNKGISLIRAIGIEIVKHEVIELIIKGILEALKNN